MSKQWLYAILLFALVSTAGASSLGSISTVSKELGKLLTRGYYIIDMRSTASVLKILESSGIAGEVTDSIIEESFNQLSENTDTAKEHITKLERISTKVKTELKTAKDKLTPDDPPSVGDLADLKTRCNTLKFLQDDLVNYKSGVKDIKKLHKILGHLTEQAETLQSILYKRYLVLGDIGRNDKVVSGFIGAILEYIGDDALTLMGMEAFEESGRAGKLKDRSIILKDNLTKMILDIKVSLSNYKNNVEILVDSFQSRCDAFDSMRDDLADLGNSRRTIERDMMNAKFAHERSMSQAAQSSFMNSAAPSTGSSGSGCKMINDPNFVQDPRCNMDRSSPDHLLYCDLIPMVQSC